MQEKGYSPATIGCALGSFSNFFRWCSERRIDPECEADFNPAGKAKRPQVRRYQGAKLLSREEMERLPRTMQRDPSELGKRDFTFTLACLRQGVPLKNLQQLKWGRVEHDPEGAWVRWRPGTERHQMPREVWEAIREALEEGGWLAVTQAGDYVFSPLAESGKEETGSKAEDWRAERHLSSDQFLSNLKLYGKLAVIDEERVTLMALRKTAIRLRLNEGASLEEMRSFMDCHEEARFTKYRLGKLPQLPPEQARTTEESDQEDRVPNRKAKPFKPGEGTTHGFYARSQPPESVAAMIKEDVWGIEEAIIGMRMLARGLLERQGQARNPQEAAQLGEAYTLAAHRIGEMIRIEKELTVKGKSSQWAEDCLARLDKAWMATEGRPISEEARKEAMDGEHNLETAARRLVEEIASTRYTLRNLFRMASEAEKTEDQVRLVGIYSSACSRLLRLLKIEGTNAGQLETFLKESIDQALVQVVKELGLDR